MKKEEQNAEINEIKQTLDKLSDSFSKMGDGLNRMVEVVETVSENCMKRVINRPFFMQPSFWTAFIAVSGLIGLLLTWQQQVKVMRSGNIQKQISIIENFQAKENRAITKARILIINQTLDCPFSNAKKIKEMEKARNRSIINIITFSSNIKVTGNAKAKKILTELIQKIYFLKPNKICEINANKFDDQLRLQQIQLNKILVGEIEIKKRKLNELESRFFMALNHSENMVVVGEAENGQDGLALIAEKDPDCVVLMDFHMPRGPGPEKLELIQQAKKINPSSKLIIITGEHNPYLLSLMLAAGANSISIISKTMFMTKSILSALSSTRIKLPIVCLKERSSTTKSMWPPPSVMILRIRSMIPKCLPPSCYPMNIHWKILLRN